MNDCILTAQVYIQEPQWMKSGVMVTRRCQLPFVPDKGAEFKIGDITWTVRHAIWNVKESAYECECEDQLLPLPNRDELVKSLESDGWDLDYA